MPVSRILFHDVLEAFLNRCAITFEGAFGERESILILLFVRDTLQDTRSTWGSYDTIESRSTSHVDKMRRYTKLRTRRDRLTNGQDRIQEVVLAGRASVGDGQRRGIRSEVDKG